MSYKCIHIILYIYIQARRKLSSFNELPHTSLCRYSSSTRLIDSMALSKQNFKHCFTRKVHL